MEKGILVIFFEDTLRKLIYYQQNSMNSMNARFSEFDSQNVVLFQFKVFGRSIKDTMLA